MHTANVLVTRGAPRTLPYLDRLSRAAGLTMNVLRGRVTSAEARYEVLLRGSRRSLARTIDRIRRDGVDLRVQDGAAPFTG